MVFSLATQAGEIIEHQGPSGRSQDNMANWELFVLSLDVPQTPLDEYGLKDMNSDELLSLIALASSQDPDDSFTPDRVVLNAEWVEYLPKLMEAIETSATTSAPQDKKAMINQAIQGLSKLLQKQQYAQWWQPLKEVPTSDMSKLMWGKVDKLTQDFNHASLSADSPVIPPRKPKDRKSSL
jgi:hypothetical protein